MTCSSPTWSSIENEQPLEVLWGNECLAMPTDYILFIHGVNTRESASDPTYADQLFDASRPSRALLACLPHSASGSERTRHQCNKVSLVCLTFDGLQIGQEWGLLHATLYPLPSSALTSSNNALPWAINDRACVALMG